MALKTLGTNGTNTLNALVFNSGSSAAADIAQINANIKNDLVNTNPRWPDALRSGKLYVPNRGFLLLRPGDYVAYDAFGWPILVAGGAISFASTSWTHS